MGKTKLVGMLRVDSVFSRCPLSRLTLQVANAQSILLPLEMLETLVVSGDGIEMPMVGMSNEV